MTRKSAGAIHRRPFDAAVIEQMKQLERLANQLSKQDQKPEARKVHLKMLEEFDRYSPHMSDKFYWDLLSVMWHKLYLFGSRADWRKRFTAEKRFNHFLMRPHELKQFRALPETVLCFQFHQHGTENEPDICSYVLKPDGPREGWASKAYEVPKRHVLCLFDRYEQYSANIIVPEAGVAREVGFMTGAEVELGG